MRCYALLCAAGSDKHEYHKEGAMIDRSAYYDDAQWERFMTAAEGKETPLYSCGSGYNPPEL